MTESREQPNHRVLEELERQLRGGVPAGTADAADRAVAARAAAWRRIVERLAASRASSFEEGFHLRVLERLDTQRGESAVHLHLERMFVRVAAAGIAAALMLGAFNLTGGHDSSGGIVETAFGVPAADFDSVVLLAEMP